MFSCGYPDSVPYSDNATRQERAILSLMKSTGSEIIQENGQRKFGPPPDWQGPPPPKGSEIFVGHLPRNVFEDELVPLFSSVGQIYQLRLMMDFSGTTRGYGFVEYACPENARRAVAELNNFEIKPHKRIGVVMSKDNCRLFVGKLPKDKSGEEIKEAMSRYTANVVEVIVHPSFKDNSKNRGYAFVEYLSHRDAAMARRKLLPGKFLLFGSEIQVDWAQPEPEVDPETMSKVTNLYVRNIHPDFESEAHLEQLFSFAGRTADGNPLQVYKAKKMRDFAFIHYATREQAETALRLAQDDPFFGREFSSDATRLQAVWAKPPDRMQKSRRNFRNSHCPQSDVYAPTRRHFTSPPQFPAQYPQNQNGIRTNGIPSHPHAPDWNPQMMFSGQRQAPLKEERPFDGMGSDRGLRSIFDWGNQPQGQAGGDRRLQSHSSGTWSPAPAGLSPYGMSSPAPSAVMLSPGLMRVPSPSFRSLSPFVASPNPYHSFQRF